jgi:hypothetical protein
VVELTTDSVQSAVDRCDLIVELFAAELSKDDLYSGMHGLRSVPVQLLASGFSGLFAKAEEFLFVISETRHRIVNLLAWLYREAKKFDAKRDDGQDAPEPKPEEATLKQVVVDKRLVLALLASEDSGQLAGEVPLGLPQTDAAAASRSPLHGLRNILAAKKPKQTHGGRRPED